MADITFDSLLLNARESVLKQAYDELKEYGLLCVDTQILLNTLGIDPEICTEEAARH